jgi:hypothetical protein
MSTFTVSASTTTNNAWYGVPCAVHGWINCNCNNASLNPPSVCATCGQYFNGASHLCGGNGVINPTLCSKCQQWYNPQLIGHACFSTWNTTTGTTFPYTGSWNVSPMLKEVKEITTDIELTYEWSGSSSDMTLPEKFSDCFLKVGAAWSPLYPLIFSALENDEKTISFHLVVGIIDKVCVGNKVILKSVTTTKIEDNLTLMQLSHRVKEYFKENDSSDSAVHE